VCGAVVVSAGFAVERLRGWIGLYLLGLSDLDADVGCNDHPFLNIFSRGVSGGTTVCLCAPWLHLQGLCVCVCVFFFCVGGFMSCGLLKRVAERNDIV
jgi:hypothetical protein